MTTTTPEPGVPFLAAARAYRETINPSVRRFDSDDKYERDLATDPSFAAAIAAALACRLDTATPVPERLFHLVYVALILQPRACRIHGDEFDASGTNPLGEPICPHCRAPKLRAEALTALDARWLTEALPVRVVDWGPHPHGMGTVETIPTQTRGSDDVG